MSTTFRPYSPNQSLLLPPDVREWLPEGHLAHHVSDLVDGLDLTAFYAPYEGDGRRNAPYDPRMMVKVLLYAYADRGVLVAWDRPGAGRGRGVPGVGGGQFSAAPDAVRISAPAPGGLPGAVRGSGASGAGVGSCSPRQAVGRRDEGACEREQAQGDELRPDAGGGTASGRRDRGAVAPGGRDRRVPRIACLGAEVRGDELPAELRRREERLAAIRAAKARLEAAARAADDARGRQPGQDRNPKGGRPYKRAYGEPDEKAQSNFTDPESSIMMTSNEGFQQCYNAQVAVDAEHQLVVATDLTANASDQGELPVLLDTVNETFDAQLATVLADAGVLQRAGLEEPGRAGR